jgi:hypothetical protein
MRTVAGVLIAAGVLAFAGCGSRGDVHPVRGRVVLTGGDVAQLAGHHVEAVLEGDPGVRASGIIGPDGTFTLETLHDGAVRKGAREGTYRVRIVPADEDDAGKKLKTPPVAGKHLRFETSGLTLQVPASGEVTLTLGAK